MFFRNAPSDHGCIKKTAAEHRKRFDNPVHDTLPMARKAWLSLGGYKLGGLAEHAGAPVPTHRALADTKATLAALLSARTTLRR